ncbi:hypothetical protein MNBD_CHLOROFLEXI01-2494 [hydrothermal vent metagenome]|uniref:STAS/SEC14 domain-containing protein n=1 Tax=hydrothermal vent metagenome TaxID=652676 RepID=A0A3B0VV41_9ZZZZ
MTTIQVQTQLSLKTLLNSLRQLTPNELNEVSKQTALLRARRLAPNLPQKEAELLLKINQGIIPEGTRARCAALTKKSRQGNLTDEEQSELMTLVNQIELLNAKRIEYLAQLASLRKTTLSELMDDLELKPLS